MNKLIALVGMSGSGKSVVTDYLEKQEWTKIYFGGLVYGKMKEAGIEITPESQTIFRENLRKEHGMGVVAKLLLPKIQEAFKNGNTILDGLYSWDEFLILSKAFPNQLKLICIIADKDLRYSRVAVRKERPFNHEEIIHRDITEIENLAKGGPISYADYYILNNGTKEDVYKRLDEILNEIDKLEGQNEKIN